MPFVKNEVNEGQVVHGRNEEKVGETTGSTHRCYLEGCTGRRIAVRWDDRITYPFEKRMELKDGDWYIQ